MSRKWTFLTLILLLGSSGALQADPLDSPGVVYIDGQPCNRLAAVDITVSGGGFTITRTVVKRA